MYPLWRVFLLVFSKSFSFGWQDIQVRMKLGLNCRNDVVFFLFHVAAIHQPPPKFLFKLARKNFIFWFRISDRLENAKKWFDCYITPRNSSIVT